MKIELTDEEIKEVGKWRYESRSREQRIKQFLRLILPISFLLIVAILVVESFDKNLWPILILFLIPLYIWMRKDNKKLSEAGKTFLDEQKKADPQ